MFAGFLELFLKNPMTTIACLLNGQPSYLHGCKNKGSLEARFAGINQNLYYLRVQKGIFLNFLYVLSKTGDYTHNSVLIHDNSDHKTYDMLTRWPGMVRQSNIINIIQGLLLSIRNYPYATVKWIK